MEYVVPLIIVLVIVLAVVVGSRLMGRRSRSGQAPANEGRAQMHPPVQSASKKGQDKASRRGREITREVAAEASARLTPESHRRVYSLIAQHQVLNAVKEYRKATHLGLGDAAAAVAALAEFPQPTPEPTPEPEPQVPSASEPLTVDDIIKAAPAATSAEPAAKTSEVTPSEAKPAAAKPSAAKPTATSGYRYRAIVSRGEDVREVASTRLNEEIFGQIRQLALTGNYDGAARLLREHADIGETEAHEFVSMITADE